MKLSSIFLTLAAIAAATPPPNDLTHYDVAGLLFLAAGTQEYASALARVASRTDRNWRFDARHHNVTATALRDMGRQHQHAAWYPDRNLLAGYRKSNDAGLAERMHREALDTIRLISEHAASHQN